MLKIKVSRPNYILRTQYEIRYYKLSSHFEDPFYVDTYGAFTRELRFGPNQKSYKRLYYAED